jgi:3',5'-cyclic AMP phosphodiesterase CpdA
MLKAVIEQVKPDFIILTGDNTSSEHFSEDKQMLLDKYTELSDFFTEEKIYWTSAFGNHDGRGSATKEELLECFIKSPYFLGGYTDTGYYKVFCDKSLDTYTNYSFPIKSNKENKVLYNLITMDTVTPTLLGYVPFKKEQIEWYNSIYQQYKKNNGEVRVPSLMFTHYPLTAYLIMYNQRNDINAVPVLKGDKNEGVYPAIGDEIFFKPMKENKDIKGYFSGHDHVNDFAGIYKATEDYSVLLAYGRLSSYSRLGYSFNGSEITEREDFLRGGRVIDIKEDGSFITFEAVATALNEQYTSFKVEYINEINTKDYN